MLQVAASQAFSAQRKERMELNQIASQERLFASQRASAANDQETLVVQDGVNNAKQMSTAAFMHWAM
jgi:flagellar basal body L-ring protein FlgH